MFLDRIRQAANLLFAIGQITVSAIFGRQIGEISDRYPHYVLPADYAFFIWNLIFALCLGYAVFQLLPSQKENNLLRRIGWFSAGAFLANTLWMMIFPQNLVALSVFLILGILFSLIGVIVNIYKQIDDLSKWETRLVYLTFSIFFGWITVATVVNISSALVANGWQGGFLPASVWGVIILGVVGLLGGAIVFAQRGNLPYAATVIWATIAIIVNQASGAVPTASTQTIIAATIAILLIAGAAAIVRFRKSPILQFG